jgi:hypothetical protein
MFFLLLFVIFSELIQSCHGGDAFHEPRAARSLGRSHQLQSGNKSCRRRKCVVFENFTLL